VTKFSYSTGDANTRIERLESAFRTKGYNIPYCPGNNNQTDLDNAREIYKKNLPLSSEEVQAVNITMFCEGTEDKAIFVGNSEVGSLFPQI